MQSSMLHRLGAAVRDRREALNLSQKELAQKAEYAANNLSRFENGQQRPSDEVLERVAEALDTSIAQLYMAADGLTGGNLTTAPEIVEWVPLLGHVTAGAFKNVRELEPWEVESWYPSTKKLGGQGFAVRVQGESMVGDKRAYPDGCIAVFHAGKRDPENGELVMAKINGADEITFKKYVKDAGQVWLEPLNPRYPIIRDPFRVLATFQYAIIE